MPSITPAPAPEPAPRPSPAPAPAPPGAPQPPAIGDAIHYVWPDETGQHYAAVVAAVVDAEAGLVNLGGWDRNGAPVQATGVVRDPDGAPGTWHPDDACPAERAEPAPKAETPAATTEAR